MKMKSVFSDENGFAMDLYVNDKESLSISIAATDTNKWYEWGIISLSKDEVRNLIKKLQDIEPHLS